MSWLVANPLVACAIVGATKPEQVEENVRAAGWALTPEDMEEVDRLCAEPA
jgi:aryl-alcohol dehydrogenase-like predicted oxidoreductase